MLKNAHNISSNFLIIYITLQSLNIHNLNSYKKTYITHNKLTLNTNCMTHTYAHSTRIQLSYVRIPVELVSDVSLCGSDTPLDRFVSVVTYFNLDKLLPQQSLATADDTTVVGDAELVTRGVLGVLVSYLIIDNVLNH